MLSTQTLKFYSPPSLFRYILPRHEYGDFSFTITTKKENQIMKKNRAPLVIGITLLPIAFLMTVFEYYNVIEIVLLGILGCFLITILEAQLEKIPKGISLIILGVSFGLFFPDSIFINNLPQDSIEKIQLIKNIAMYACAGAGGSIIASHAEKFPHKNDTIKNSELKYLDNTKKIETIIKELDQIKKYGKIISFFIIAALLLIILIII